MNKLSLIPILILLNSFAFAQKIDVNYKFSSQKYLLEFDEIFNKSTFSDSVAFYNFLEKSRNTAINKGFVECSVDSVVFYNTSAQVYIYIGQRYKYLRINYDHDFESILRKVNSRYLNSKLFDFSLISSENQKIITYLENNAYPQSTVRLDSISMEENGISAYLKIERGEKITYGEVSISGNLKISNSFLYGYTNIKPGAAYNSESIEHVKTLINELDFAKEDEELSIYYNSKNVDVKIPANKLQNNRFDGILGILPNDKTTGKTVLTGEVNIYLQNMLHSAEEIDFQWQKLESSSQKLKVDFKIPYIFNTRLGLSAGLNLNKQDSTFLNSDLKTGVQFYFQGRNNIGVVYKNKTSSILTKDEVLKQQFNAFEINSYGLAINYRKLDYNFNPHKGVDFIIEANIGDKRSKNDSNIMISQVQYDSRYNLKYYLKLGKSHTVLIANQAAFLVSNNLYKNELYTIGGLKSLRGFMESSIYASSYSIVTLEYRFIFEKKSAMFLFFDGAWYEKEIEKYYYDYPFGFGLGLFFKTKAGIFTISYAMGQQKNESLNISNAKIHFGFINKF